MAQTSKNNGAFSGHGLKTTMMALKKGPQYCAQRGNCTVCQLSEIVARNIAKVESNFTSARNHFKGWHANCNNCVQYFVQCCTMHVSVWNLTQKYVLRFQTYDGRDILAPARRIQVVVWTLKSTQSPTFVYPCYFLITEKSEAVL